VAFGVFKLGQMWIATSAEACIFLAVNCILMSYQAAAAEHDRIRNCAVSLATVYVPPVLSCVKIPSVILFPGEAEFANLTK
jgi:hypothetical protein